MSNGLTVIAHEDQTTPMAAVNLLYRAGSKHDPVDRTGLAHLLEHMMFTGSKHAKDFDSPLQLASGENNAFTNKDITNYYDILPVGNLTTALWLESDRMRDLLFDKASFKTQKKVVIEEFKETCLNQPYGMVWHHMMDLAYKSHPYRWPTIGINESHIKSIDITDLRAYYDRYYAPDNAILSIGGNLSNERAFGYAEEWFGDMKPFNHSDQNDYPHEPTQHEFRHGTMRTSAAVDMIYMTFHMPARRSSDYYAADYISDILGNGRSSRLYQTLVKERELFISIDAFVTGNSDPGLLVVEGKLSKGINHDQAQAAIWEILETVKANPIEQREHTKLYNQMVSSVAFSNTSLLNNVMNLGYYEYIGDANLVNSEPEMYGKVTPKDIQSKANQIIQRSNCCQLDVCAKE